MAGGTTSHVLCDVFFFLLLLFISHFCTTLTLCSRFCGASVLFLRRRTTAFKGPYDELMMSPEITRLLGSLKYFSLFIALLNAYQLQGGVAPNTHPVLFA